MLMIKTPNRTNGPLKSGILSYFKSPEYGTRSSQRELLRLSLWFCPCGSPYGYQAHAPAVRDAAVMG